MQGRDREEKRGEGKGERLVEGAPCVSLFLRITYVVNVSYGRIYGLVVVGNLLLFPS